MNYTLDENKNLINILDVVYPIGSIYMSVNSTNPSTLFGGAWEKLENRFLLGAGSSYSLGATGGETSHTLIAEEIPSHNHSISLTTSSNGAHTHTRGSMNITGRFHSVVWNNASMPPSGAIYTGHVDTNNMGGSGTWDHVEYVHDASRSWSGETSSNGSHTHSISGVTNNTGNSQAHNNMPPYLVVNIWKRTA